MPVGLNENPVGMIDPACPLDWSHPLNRGLVGRWKVIPNSGWRGGLTFRDLSRGGKKPNDGTLNNSPTWVGGGRRGGYGALYYPGTAYVQVPTNTLFDIGTGELFFSCWAKLTTSVVYNPLFCIDSGFSGAGFDVSLLLGDYVYVHFGGNPLSITPIPNAYVWRHYAVTRVGTTLSIYIDGQLATSGTRTESLPSGQNVYIGTNPGINFNGYIDDTCFGRIGKSAAEVSQLYQEQLRGSPETLRWVGAKTYGISEQGGVVPATQYQYRSLLGVGI